METAPGAVSGTAPGRQAARWVWVIVCSGVA